VLAAELCDLGHELAAAKATKLAAAWAQNATIAAHQGLRPWGPGAWHR
jgi:hypothetical protein